MAHYCMKAGGKWQAEAASWDRGLVCLLLREQVQWSMGIFGVVLSEGCTLGYRRGAAVYGGGALGDSVGACF